MAEDNAAFIRRWFDEVWNKGRMDAIDEMASPEVIGHGQAQHSTDIGMVEFKKLARDIRSAFPDIHFIIEDVITQGDKVVARWSARMTHAGTFLGTAATGRAVTVTGISVQHIVKGKIVEGWDNWDQLGLLVQIGAVPAATFVQDSASPRAKAS
jgi:steroid delta-isomerase-like uncharacterized protein